MLSDFKQQNLNERGSSLKDHGIAGFLYATDKEKLPTSVGRECRQEWQLQWERNTLYMREIERLSQRLPNIEITVLKGISLLDDIYMDWGGRSMGDIDLLIDHKDCKEVLNTLQEMGYCIVPTDQWKGNDFKYNLSRWDHGRELVFEIHSRLFWTEPKDFSWKKENWKYGSLQMLSQEDRLVHLLGHLGFQHTFYHLSWLVDIYLVVKKYNDQLDWERVWSLAEQLELKESVLAGLWACQEFFQIRIPFLEQKMKRKRLWQYVINEEFLWNPVKSKWRYFLVKHLMKDKWRDAFIYDWMWMWNWILKKKK